MTISEDSQLIPVPPGTSAPMPIPQQHRRRSHGPKWSRPIRKALKRIKWRTVLLVTVAIVAVTMVASLVLIVDAMNRVSSALNGLERVAQSVRSKPGTELTFNDFDRLHASVVDLSNTLGAAQRQIGFMGIFAPFNPELDAQLASIRSAFHLTLAADDMLKGLEPTLFLLVSGDDSNSVVASGASGNRIVELLQVGRGQVVSARGYLDQAEADIRHLDLTRLSPSSVLNIEGLNSYRSQLAQINELLMTAPDLFTTMLGLSEEKNYLVLSQNSDEIRPSGGYISTYGWMTVRNGRITDYSYSPTTATSPNPPPVELASQVQIPDWWIQYDQPLYAAWDGSWQTDFPSTASMAMWYYNNGNNPQSPLDGVIAIDIVGFEYLLNAIGSVAVSNYDTVVTPENFRQVVYDIRAVGEGDVPHKRFLAELYQEIFNAWEDANADPTTRERLVGALLQGFQEKHIMLYFAETSLNEIVNLLGWSGAQTPALNHDYLMVVDANLGNKSNRSVQREVTYDVALREDGTADSRLAISYDYSARVAALDPAVNPAYHGPLTYNNLLQVFAPLDAQLLNTTGLSLDEITVIREPAHSRLVTEVTVPFDSSERFQFSWQSTGVVEQIGRYHHYRLLVQKQPGTRSDVTSVQVALPVGAALVNVRPEPSASYNLDSLILEFRFNLTTDSWIEIAYEQ